MNLTVTIDGTNRTSAIDWPSFRIDNALKQVTTCSFQVKTHGSSNWIPAVGKEIIVTDGSPRIFGGVIVQVKQIIEGLQPTYEAQCKDWTQYLDRVLVVDKTYTSQTVNAIISDLNTNYLTGFTINNVSCTTVIPSIYFTKTKVSDCLDQLAAQVGYNWYVDYDKDIHFIADDTEAAPFGLTDTNGNYIFNSLDITDDITQLKNKVYVIEDSANKVYKVLNFATHDGLTTYYFDYTFYPAAGSNNLPRPYGAVVWGQGYNVYLYGTETPAGQYWAYWHADTRSLVFNGYPGPDAAAQLNGMATFYKEYADTDSINTYGQYMFTDNGQITNLDMANQFANSIFSKYKDKQQSGTFKTYTSGLKAGQIISIGSTLRNISGNFLIQNVSLRMRTPTDGEFTVEFAIWRTNNLINILLNTIKN